MVLFPILLISGSLMCMVGHSGGRGNGGRSGDFEGLSLKVVVV